MCPGHRLGTLSANQPRLHATSLEGVEIFFQCANGSYIPCFTARCVCVAAPPVGRPAPFIIPRVLSAHRFQVHVLPTMSVSVAYGEGRCWDTLLREDSRWLGEASALEIGSQSFGQWPEQWPVDVAISQSCGAKALASGQSICQWHWPMEKPVPVLL